jgi:hypothetical protein
MSNNVKKIIRHIIIVLKFPRKVNDFIAYAKGIYKAMNGNTAFPDSADRIAALNTHTLALDAAETALHTKPPTGTVAFRDAASEVVKADLRALRSDVQTVADKNPSQADVLAKSAGMDIKHMNTQKKRGNTAENDEVTGTIVLTAEDAGPHEWQMSKDQVNSINLPATSKAKSKVFKLISGDTWYFRSRPILTQGEEGEWCQWIKIVVK